MGAGGNTNTVATVNGKAVSNLPIDNYYYQLQSQARTKGFYSSTQAFATALKKQALTTVLHQEALLQAAKASGFMLSPLVVQAAIEAMPAFKVNGQFSPQKFQDYVNNNPNAQLFLTDVHDQQLLNQVSSGFISTAFVTSAAAKKIETYAYQQRHLGYFSIPFSRFTNTAGNISLAAQRAYYNKHKI